MLNLLERKERGLFDGKTSKAIITDLKALDQNGEFEGYASIFNNVDLGDDIVMPGAFTESLAKRGPDKVKMLYQHYTDTPIGKWLQLQEDGRGLFAKGRLFTNIQKGAEVYELMREGALDGMSIGYRTIVDEWDRENNIRRLKQVDLKEISIVTFPMNEQAIVSLVKAGQMPTERELERWLVRDAGFSAKQAKAFIAGGYKALSNARDAGGSEDLSPIVGALTRLRESLAG